MAKIINLVDEPNLRKQHEGAIPLVGGIAVFATIAQYIYNNPDIIKHSELFLIAIAIITVVGVIDDRFDLSYKIRLIVQTMLTIFMMFTTGLELNSIGDVFATGNIELGILTPVITVLAVLGAINAFNMVDGIDGLLGGLSIVTFTSLAVILALAGQTSITFLCLVFVVAMVPYVLMNLGILGRQRRIFMGDAGSMMIGFSVIWLLLSASQTSATPVMRPVTALWLIALPLMDMAAIMYRRLRRGRSPFRPDRDHLHHICQRIGLSDRQTLAFICAIASVFATIGILGEVFAVHESVMLGLFVVCFFAYNLMLLIKWPRQTSGLTRASSSASPSKVPSTAAQPSITPTTSSYSPAPAKLVSLASKRKSATTATSYSRTSASKLAKK